MTQYTARLTGAVPFNLQETFECGQCFRWLPGDDGSYTGVVGQNVITLRTDGDDLLVAGLDQAEAEQRLIPYLALDEDYAAIQEQFRRNAQLAQAVDYARGIRVLRQDRWEALCSFIISQNNNIKRIRGIVETLCDTWGEPLPGGRSSFPGPEVLASLTEEDLQPLRSGFRAKYILDAARKTASGEVDLDHVASLPTEEAAAELCRIRGVGIKVAHCALLYGFHRIECLPVDVWMKRVMSTMYPQGLPEELLPYAGIAQQYLFHYSRSHPELFEACLSYIERNCHVCISPAGIPADPQPDAL